MTEHSKTTTLQADIHAHYCNEMFPLSANSVPMEKPTDSFTCRWTHDELQALPEQDDNFTAVSFEGVF